MKRESKQSKGWKELNTKLMKCESLLQLKKMLETEQKGKNRSRFVMRIHSRLNRVRASRERQELKGT